MKMTCRDALNVAGGRKPGATMSVKFVEAGAEIHKEILM
jgi:hypothetical protein